MKLYYGTTSADRNRLLRDGIRPSTSSGEVWLSRSLPVARARARQLCRRGRDEPVVALCSLPAGAREKRKGEIRCRGPMVALRGAVAPGRIVRFLPVVEPVVAPKPAEAVLTAAEVFRLLDSPSPRVRLMGVMMLSSQETTQTFDWLCTRLEDRDPRVRLAVAMALRRRGREAFDVLKGMGLDQDPRVRRAARQGIEPAATLLA